MSKYSSFLPPPIAIVYGLFLPTVICLYVFTDRSLVNSLNQDELNYFTFANDSLGRLILSQSWQNWLSRALDFVLWGAIGGIFLLMFWIVSSSRIAIHNHRVQKEFVNFKVPKGTWHSQFVVIALIKAITLFLTLYCVGATIFIALPLLIDSVTLLSYSFSISTAWPMVLSFIFMIVMQYLVLLGIRLFNIIRVDD